MSGKGNYLRKKKEACYSCSICQKTFKYQKASKKCEIKCSAHQGVATEVADNIECVVKFLVKENAFLRAELAKERAERILAINDLKKLISETTGRGSYTMRKRIPTSGFGAWSSSWFLEHIQEACDWFGKCIGYSLKNTTAIMFIVTVLYFANDKTKLIEFGNYPKDKYGVPLYCDINTHERMLRHVSMDGVVKKIFQKSFIPSEDELKHFVDFDESAIDMTFLRNWRYTKKWIETSFGGIRKHGAWETRWDLIQALATYEEPCKPTGDTLLKETIEIEGANFWRHMDIGDLHVYDKNLKDCSKYIEILTEYFTANPDKLGPYRLAGGTLV